MRTCFFFGESRDSSGFSGNPQIRQVLLSDRQVMQNITENEEFWGRPKGGLVGRRQMVYIYIHSIYIYT